MSIAFDSIQTVGEVFETYAAKERDGVQVRTHVPVALMGDGFEAHVTRSQGKRLVERLDTFDEVLLDFKNVESIGRAFADEVFRTFRSRNPHVSVITTNANPSVRSRIRAVLQD
jgi:hypothetical protein